METTQTPQVDQTTQTLSKNRNIKLSTRLVSGLALTTLTIVPFGFTLPAQAASFARVAYGPNGSAERAAT